MQVERELQKSAVGVPRDEVIAIGVTFDEYMEKYAHDFAEYVDGVVIKMSPVHRKHDASSRFLDNLFEAYLFLLGGGVLLRDPMVMKMETPLRAREPDLMILLPENVGKLKETYVEGAADLVVEIISPESVERDRGEKFVEYERAGVKEYWILDPMRQETLFYVRSADGMFQRQSLDADGYYTSTVLPKLRFKVDLLWQDPLPNIVEVVELVRAMFAEQG